MPTDRRDFALAYFERLRDESAAGGESPPLGLHLLTGGRRPELVRNMISNVSAHLVAPVELIARKPDAICRWLVAAGTFARGGPAPDQPEASGSLARFASVTGVLSTLPVSEDWANAARSLSAIVVLIVPRGRAARGSGAARLSLRRRSPA